MLFNEVSAYLYLFKWYVYNNMAQCNGNCFPFSSSSFSPLHWSQKGIRIDLDIDCNGLCSVVVAMLILGYLTEKVGEVISLIGPTSGTQSSPTIC